MKNAECQNLFCWACSYKLDLPEGSLSFRATCANCDAWLHVCMNCKYYQPGLPNDCRVPGTELIADREKYNYCEEFSLLGKEKTSTLDLKDVEKRLFGDSEDTSNSLKKNRFDSLFND